MIRKSAKPSWDRLYEIATEQEGHFTTAQAGDAGYSSQLLAKYLKSRKVERVRRGIYRIVHYPGGEYEDLVVAWLWSDRAGVFSHETALALHDLSDALPARRHMTLPVSWKARRLRTPRGLVLHHAELRKKDRAWSGSLPVTSPVRTLHDCAEAHVAPDLVRQALREGLARGLFTQDEVNAVEEHLERFDCAGR